MKTTMDPQWQMQTFCVAADRDLSFIDQIIPYLQMAIDISEAAPDRAVHPELVVIANDVITAQQAEIMKLEIIRAELIDQATPNAA